MPAAPEQLHARLGEPAGDVSALVAALAETRLTTLDRLAAAGLARHDAEASPLSALSLPESMATLLAVAVAAAERAGDPGHAAMLRLQYLEALPGARLEQLLSVAEPGHRLFHSPAPWARLPRFVRGLERLFALLRRHGLEPEAVLGAEDPGALLARYPTLAAWYAGTYYGGILPMFQALPHDLAASLPAGSGDETFWAAVDHRLALPMLHEVLHFAPSRAAIFPPYLDEALAGHFGVVIDEASAYPAPDDDHALVGWPWFSQVGEALCRAFGEGPVLAAHAGIRPWTEVLPAPLLTAIERLAWGAYRSAPAVHFHPDTTRPDRWVKLIYAAAAGHAVDDLALEDLDALPWEGVALPADPVTDREILRHGVTAMCLAAEQVGGSWRVRRALPLGPVTVDLDRGYITAPQRPLDPAAPRYALPPRPGRGKLELAIADASPGALDAQVAHLEGALGA